MRDRITGCPGLNGAIPAAWSYGKEEFRNGREARRSSSASFSSHSPPSPSRGILRILVSCLRKQNRFCSCLLDKDYYWAALRYVERNPVRARLVCLPWRYPWSSAAVHTGRAEPTRSLEAPQWSREISPKEWEAELRGTDDEEMVRLLRIRTQTGRPLGSDRFMSKVEAFLGRRVRPLPVGRQQGWRKDKTRGKGK